jgi:HSP90 family molecular chaperone
LCAYRHPFAQSITKEGLQLPEAASGGKRLESAYKTKFKPLTDLLKKVYENKVEKVTVSSRLATTPCVLVTSQFGYSANMERIMKSQAFADPSRASFMGAKKTMEVNPRHPIIAELLKRAEALGEGDEATEEIKDVAKILYDSALLNSGFSMDEPKAFSARLFRLIKAGLDIESLELLPEMDVPAEEESASGEAAATEGADADADDFEL